MQVNGYNVSANGLMPNAYELDGVSINEPSEEEIARAGKWIAAFCTPRKSINHQRSSYGLKHRAESWAGAYVSNGAFIVAALRAGYRLYNWGINATFNMSVRKRPSKDAV